jgi:hypothetical protein
MMGMKLTRRIAQKVMIKKRRMLQGEAKRMQSFRDRKAEHAAADAERERLKRSGMASTQGQGRMVSVTCPPTTTRPRRRGQNPLTQESRFDSRLQIRGGSLEPRRSDGGRVAYLEDFVAG